MASAKRRRPPTPAVQELLPFRDGERAPDTDPGGPAAPPARVVAPSSPAKRTRGRLAVPSRTLIASSTGRDQAAALLARVDLAGWRRLRVRLRELREAATADADDTPNVP